MGIYLGTTKVDMKSPIKDVIPGLSSENIKGGTTVGGVEGKTSVMETEDMTATAADMLEGATGAVNGQVIEGSIPRKAAASYTPSTTDQTIAKGQYLEGDQIVKGDPNLVAENIAEGKTIFGVSGTFAGGADGTYFSRNDVFQPLGSDPIAVPKPAKLIIVTDNTLYDGYWWFVGHGVYKNNPLSGYSLFSTSATTEITVEDEDTFTLKLSEDGMTVTAENTNFPVIGSNPHLLIFY